MPVETEIKLRAPAGAPEACRLLEQHGYRPNGPRMLEIDQLYDLPGEELRRSGRLLRVRFSGSQWILTYKGPGAAGPHKSREEIETRIWDGEALTAILNALGYLPSFRYEKYRTKYTAPEEPGFITVDETPMGDFLELEGPGYWIDRTAARLGFSPEEYVTSSYAALYQNYRQSNPAVPKDMTF
jgi:adenylate cyclase class 2